MGNDTLKSFVRFYLILFISIFLAGCAGTMKMKHLDKYLTKYQKGDTEQALKLAKKFEKIPSEFRLHAIGIMKTMGDSMILPYFDKWLDIYKQNIANSIVDAIGNIKHQGGVSVIRKYLLNSQTVDTALAVNSLAAIGPLFIDPAFKLLDDSSKLVVDICAEAFIKLGEPSIKPIVKKYPEAGNKQKEYSERILGEIGVSAFKFLVPVLADRKRKKLAENVLVSGSDDAVPALLAELGKNDYSQNSCIHKVLVEIGAPAVPLIREKLTKSETSVDDKLLLAKVLSEIIDPTALDALIAGTADENMSVILYCLRYIGLRPSITATHPMVKLLRNDDADIRLRAKDVLIAIGPPVAEAVMEIIDDEDPFIRKLAHQVLDQIGVSGGDNIISSGLNDPDPAIRIMAIEQIGKEQGVDGIKWIIPLLFDDYAMVRYCLNATFARTRENAYPVLVEMMKGGENVKWPPENMRNDLFFSRLVTAITATNNPQGMKSIISQWDKMDDNGHTMVMHALIILGQTWQGRKVLDELLANETRAGVVIALLQTEMIINNTLTEPIIPFIHNVNPNIRTAAARYVATVKVEDLCDNIAQQLIKETYYPAIINQLRALQEVGRGSEINAASMYLSSLNHKLRYSALAAVQAMVERTKENTLTAMGHLKLAQMYAVEGEFSKAEDHYQIIKKLNPSEKSIDEKIALMETLRLNTEEDNRVGSNNHARDWVRYIGLVRIEALSLPKDITLELKAAKDTVFTMPQPPPDLSRDPKATYVDGFDITVISTSMVSELRSGNFCISSKNGFVVVELQITNISKKHRYINLDITLARNSENILKPISFEASKVVSIGEEHRSEVIAILSGNSKFIKLVYEKESQKEKISELLMFPSNYLGSLPVVVKL
ncbi:MAG: hypothetical protein P9X24_12755 [Candidatus Hatepunaea meridiana]|nr:hypothetical protein [Candidatus Hatepunaea meridiana]